MYALMKKGFWWRIKIKIIMNKLLKKRGLLAALAVVVFQICAFVLITILTVKIAIAVLLALICVVCLGIVNKVIYIKLK